MSNSTFQAQLVSIMEVLAKAAVAEINRRVDDSCAVIRLEMSRSQRDIDVLKRKYQLMENELRRTRGRARKRGSYYGTLDRLCLTSRSMCVRERSHSVWREQTVPTTQETTLASSHNIHQTVSLVEEEPEMRQIKQEVAEEELWRSSEASEKVPFDHEEKEPFSPGLENLEEQTTSARNPEGQNTHLAHFTHVQNSSEVVSEQIRHSDETLNALAFHVKAEREEEDQEGEQNKGQEEYERKEGDRDNLEFVLDERDAQLWTSIAEQNSDPETAETGGSFPTTQLSQHLAIYPQPGAAGLERPGNDPRPAAETQVELYGAGQVSLNDQSQPSWAERSRQQQGQNSDRLRSVNDSMNVQHRLGAIGRPGVGAIGANMAAPAGANMAAPALFAGFGRGGLGASKRLRTHWRSGTDVERRFSCSFCQRSFARFSQLKEHLRSHTGEKPYSCTQCGRSFTKQCNLIRHAVVHSGEKPYQCSQCGKCFTQRSSLKSHQKTHLGERERGSHGLSVCGSTRDSHSSVANAQSRGFL